MLVKVVNLRHEGCDIRIDRRSPWGNPFKIEKGVDRECAIHMYRAWIRDEEQGHLVDELFFEMRKQRMNWNGRTITLGCWCAPESCHGDVLTQLIRTEWPFEL